MDTRAEATPGSRRVAPLAVLAATLCAVGLVALVHHCAAPRISANEHSARIARLTAVLGDARFDNDVVADVVMVRDAELLGTDRPLPLHRARLGGRPVAALLEVVAPSGYGGAIHLLVAVKPDGSLIGVRVLSHAETPGVGDAIEPQRSGWLERLSGRALGNPALEGWAIRKDGGDFDQYTGATVTSRAVVGAVRDVLRWYDAHRDQVFAAPSEAPTGDD